MFYYILLLLDFLKLILMSVDIFSFSDDILNVQFLIPNINAVDKNDSQLTRLLSSKSIGNHLCSAVPKTDMNCCWPGEVCGIGEGDCDFDVDCANGLKCGKDNCYYDFPTSDIRENWDTMADCCYGNKICHKIKFKFFI